MENAYSTDFEAKKDMIRGKAARLFAKKGYLQTSLQEIAHACNMAKSLIYHYFPSKQHVLYEIVSSHVDQLLLDVSHVQEQNLDAPRAVDLMVRRFMRHYSNAVNRHKVFVNDTGHLSGEMLSNIQVKSEKILSSVQDMLAILHPRLQQNPIRARVQARLLFGMINWSNTWFEPDGSLTADEISDMISDTIRAPLVSTGSPR